ncbi:50S ribosomal protein L32 [Patescibacteria group bacterium]|nr:50S ribosomal protein L32 [Patescibacteria group bacterium]
MTPLPKRRWSTRRQGKKRATHIPAKPVMVKCPNCGELRKSHNACLKCGFYRDRQVLPIAS